MLFNSFTYIIFFIIVSSLYFIIPHRFRWILLLISSYIFYMTWNPVLIFLIIFSTFINYVFSIRIYKSKNKRKRKKFLFISLIINFGLLFVFKYLTFINNSFIYIFNQFGISWAVKEFDIILPMGISFYTFQAASYTIDVYKEKLKPETHYGIFSLFITFFPQLVAGPIERSINLLPQFYERHKFNLERTVSGLKIILIGYFKKVVIADRVAIAVNTIFNSVHSYSGLYFIITAVLFTFQIYCDFSGYSDIAVGSAKILGFDLMKNFQNPYLSKSIKEFWRRWHISLSTWFMDYVYIPLGGNRKGKFKQCCNLMITFLLSGLWHGSNWTFVIWGGLHGVYQVIGIITFEVRKKIKNLFHINENLFIQIFDVIFTFILVAFGLIIFRANTISDAFYVISNLFTNFKIWFEPQYLYEVITGLGLNLYELKCIVFAIFILVLSEIISKKEVIYEFLETKPIIINIFYYILIATIVISMGVYYDAGAFIYFQF